MKKCPCCAEEIQEEAIKCKHCGEWLVKDEKPAITSITPTESVDLEQAPQSDKFEKTKIYGDFRWAKVSPFGKNGRWRRKGFIEFGDDGITIHGYYVYHFFIRVLVMIPILVGVSIITIGVFGILAILPAFVLANYVVLRKGNIFVPYDNLNLFAADTGRKMIGLTLSRGYECTPVIFQSADWQEAIRLLRLKVPNKDATSNIVIGKGSKECPSCGSQDIYGAYIEDGSWGDWCPHCKKSIQKMSHEI